VEQTDAAIARQHHGKHIPAATDPDKTIEDVVLSMQALLRTN
jgi:hypothetical protein